METLKKAIESQDKLLSKLSKIIKQIKEEDPKKCSKMDFLSESEHIQEELSKFKDGINKGLQSIQTRETCIEEILKKMQEKADPIN